MTWQRSQASNEYPQYILLLRNKKNISTFSVEQSALFGALRLHSKDIKSFLGVWHKEHIFTLQFTSRGTPFLTILYVHLRSASVDVQANQSLCCLLKHAVDPLTTECSAKILIRLWKRRLIWGFAGHTRNLVGNTMPRLICKVYLSLYRCCTTFQSRPSCSKLTMLLVNVSYKLWSSNLAYTLIFLLKKCE